LFTYNDNNDLVGDLAKDFTIDARGTTYTVTLKPDLKWHDGKPLTADDVAFTYSLIQTPDAQSPLQRSWQGIKVAAVNPTTVTFTLPNQLAAFPYSLTNGIVPEHILGDKRVNSLRSLAFNTSEPVGSGPFKMNALQVTGGSAESREEYVALEPFDSYHAGKPKVDRFVVHSFRNKDRMIESFQKREINAIAGLTSVPSELNADDLWIYNMPLTAAVMTFFKQTEGVLADVSVRKALIQAADTQGIIEGLSYPAMPVRQPLLANQVGYNAAFSQAPYNVAAANTLLDEQGWQPGGDGVRRKAGQKLTFRLSVQQGSEYERVAQKLKQQWRVIGADVKVDVQDNMQFQTTLLAHDYDALLHGIAIGKDPDVYVYWDSKQADPLSDSRLNFSEFKSAAADDALQAGRTRSDPALRGVKYQPFLQAWQNEAPALGLYQPRFLYITRSEVYGLKEHAINADVERFTSVNNWMIRTAGVSQTAK